MRLSTGAGIAGSFRAISDALGEAEGPIPEASAAFTVIVSRFGVRRSANHRERNDGQELDDELPVGRRAG
jgi:hypothetical protein